MTTAKTKSSSPASAARRSRPRNSGRNSRRSRIRAGISRWFDASAARAHLQQIDREMTRLTQERELIMHVLGRPIAAVANWLNKSVTGPRRPGRRPRGGGPSMLDLLERIIAQGPAGKGWTVGELREQLSKLDPIRATTANASALISSALVQALRAKRPRFIGSKGGRGHARKYKLASAKE
jgi:hypothetical protein